MNNEGAVAFHAVNSGPSVHHVGAKQKIVFNKVNINAGAGYHAQHGLFIAPQPGLYIFSMSIFSDNAQHPKIDVSLMKDGVLLARAAGNGGRDQGSVTVVTQLDTGNEVWVELYLPADTAYYGDYFTSFMGCLVYPV